MEKLNYADTLKYICDKYNIDVSKSSPFYLNIGRYRDIPGLFKELGFKVGAEVGVYRGAYSERLLNKIPGLKLYGIDSWTSYPGYTDPKKDDMDDAYEAVLELALQHDFSLIKDWSSEAVKKFEDESLDFVFIDGNHAYEYVVEDIALWSKKVRSGGIVYGHDFDDYSRDVKKQDEINVINAVEGWMKSYRIHPWFVTTNNKNKCWMYIKS